MVQHTELPLWKQEARFVLINEEGRFWTGSSTLGRRFSSNIWDAQRYITRDAAAMRQAKMLDVYDVATSIEER